MMNFYLIFSTVLFAFLTFIWSTKSWLNVFLRLMFGVMTVVGIVQSLIALGVVFIK